MNVDTFTNAWISVGARPLIVALAPTDLERWSYDAIEALDSRGYQSGYLSSGWWKIIRTLAVYRARLVCEFDGWMSPQFDGPLEGPPSAGLQVHHLNYDRLGCELPDDLITLCWMCHEDAHEFPRLEQQIRSFATGRQAPSWWDEEVS